MRIVSKEAQSRIANGAADHLAVDDWDGDRPEKVARLTVRPRQNII